MDKGCPLYYTSNLIGKRWTLMILLQLYKGENNWKRYFQLKEKLPTLTPKMLSARLKEMEKEGLISKRVDSSTVPIKSEYSLTDKGQDFINVIKQMKAWTVKWKSPVKCKATDCKSCTF